MSFENASAVQLSLMRISFCLRLSTCLLAALCAAVGNEIDSANAETPSYWVWAGHTLASFPADAPLYIHQATFERPPKRSGRSIRPGSVFRVRRQGVGPIEMPHRELWLTYRVEGLVAPQQLVDLFLADASLWTHRNNAIVGLQIDFDSPTKRLGDYAKLLREVRAGLKPEYRLSVTGLADWAANAPDAALAEIAQSVDEIIFQLYRGRTPIADFERYVSQLSRVAVPYRVGILESQRNSIPAAVLNSGYYRGAVIFPLKGI